MSEIVIEVGKLGEPLHRWTFPEGTTVGEVVDKAEINGDAHTIRLDGEPVERETKIFSDCRLVAVANTKFGGI